MNEYIRRAVVCAFAFITLTLASGCNPATSVLVVQDGVPVASAEVYVNNTMIGQTDASGVLALPRGITSGTRLSARKQIFEIPGFRPNHGPENGGLSWIERVYLTSMEVTEGGTLERFVVSDPASQQTLVLSNDNTLIGLHFMVSVIWDASDVELEQIGEKFRQAGEYIYNATDGQIYFEQVDIVDDNTFWRDAEYHWYADTAAYPNCWSLRGLFVPNVFGSAVVMSRRSDQLGDFKTIAHEFGHLGFGLMDEYLPDGAFCTARRRTDPGSNPGNNPAFQATGSKASCLMEDQWNASKFCSNHPDNPHTDGTLQAASCWSAIASGFADTRTPVQWRLKTPDTRRGVGVGIGIVDRLQEGLPPQWQARINIDNRVAAGLGTLCQPFDITLIGIVDRRPVVNFPISLATGSRIIALGPTRGDGAITIVGAHVGDRIWTGLWTNVVATPSLGPNTCGLTGF